MVISHFYFFLYFFLVLKVVCPSYDHDLDMYISLNEKCFLIENHGCLSL